MFITTNLSTYKLARQIDETHYLYLHISGLAEFQPIILESELFHREGFNGKKQLDVIFYGISFFDGIGQIIQLTEL